MEWGILFHGRRIAWEAIDRGFAGYGMRKCENVGMEGACLRGFVYNSQLVVVCRVSRSMLQSMRSVIG